MSFGFSAGDFIAAFQLLNNLRKALNETTGSAANYEALHRTLKSLEDAICSSSVVYTQWEAMSIPAQYKQSASSTIQAMAYEQQQCLNLVEAFLTKTRVYEDAFVRKNRRRFTTNFRKITWTGYKDDVQQLERNLQGHLSALNLWTNTLVQNYMAANVSMMNEQFDELKGQLQNQIPSSLGLIWPSVSGIEESVLLLDAVGRTVLLPMLFLSTPDLFHDLLRIMYNGIPGGKRISRREYALWDEDAGGLLIEPSEWAVSIRPGMRLGLSATYDAPESWKIDHCPKCAVPILGRVLPGQRKRCQMCQLTFRVFEKERFVEVGVVTAQSPITYTAPDSQELQLLDVRNNSTDDSQSICRSSRSQRIVEEDCFVRIQYTRYLLKPLIPKSETATENKLDILDVRKEHIQPLLAAIIDNSLEKIQRLCAEYTDISEYLDRITWDFVRKHYRYHDNWSGCLERIVPLQIAATVGTADMVKYLISQGAEIDVQDSAGSTALMWAAWQGKQDTASSLIDQGASLTMFDNEGHTPLHLAALYKHPQLVSICLEAGANIHARDAVGFTALHLAARSGSDECAKILLDAGASPSAVSTQGISPLHLAACESDSVTQLLIERGASILDVNQWGQSPLFNAAFLGNNPPLKALIEAGAAINTKNIHNISPLYAAALRGKKEVVQELIKFGAEINSLNGGAAEAVYASCWVSNDLSSTPRSTAISFCDRDPSVPLRWSKPEVMGCILRHHLSASFSSMFKGTTPLGAAVISGDVATCRLLLELGAEVDLHLPGHVTPLIIAIQMDHIPITKLLLQYGARIDAQVAVGMTALGLAITQNREELVKLLLEYDFPDGYSMGDAMQLLHRRQKLHLMGSIFENLAKNIVLAGEGLQIIRQYDLRSAMLLNSNGSDKLALDIDLLVLIGPIPFHLITSTSQKDLGMIGDKRLEIEWPESLTAC